MSEAIGELLPVALGVVPVVSLVVDPVDDSTSADPRDLGERAEDRARVRRAAPLDVNPKNLTLCLTGGIIIGSARLAAGETTVVIAVFVVLGSCSVAVPVLGYQVAQRGMERPLAEMRDWLTAHHAAVMTVLMLVIGVAILGKGTPACDRAAGQGCEWEEAER